jgi:hypothetical protein
MYHVVEPPATTVAAGTVAMADTQTARLARAVKLDLPPATKLLLLTLINHSKVNGRHPNPRLVHPSQSTLTQETGYSERHIRRLLRELEELGELRTEVLTTQRGRKNVYILTH